MTLELIRQFVARTAENVQANAVFMVVFVVVVVVISVGVIAILNKKLFL